MRLAQWDVLRAARSPAELGRVRGETWNRRPLKVRWSVLECAGATLESPPALLGYYCMFRIFMESHRGNGARPGESSSSALVHSRHLCHGQ
jgi:hypothetical protein